MPDTTLPACAKSVNKHFDRDNQRFSMDSSRRPINEGCVATVDADSMELSLRYGAAVTVILQLPLPDHNTGIHAISVEPGPLRIEPVGHSLKSSETVSMLWLLKCYPAASFRARSASDRSGKTRGPTGGTDSQRSVFSECRFLFQKVTPLSARKTRQSSVNIHQQAHSARARSIHGVLGGVFSSDSITLDFGWIVFKSSSNVPVSST